MDKQWLHGPAVPFDRLPLALQQWARGPDCCIPCAAQRDWRELPVVHPDFAYKVMHQGDAWEGVTTREAVAHRFVAQDEDGTRFYVGLDPATQTILWGR